jgi:alanine racemase
VLGYVQPNDLEEALALGCELTVYDTERLSLLETASQKSGKPARIHVKIDAHLGRQGILLSDLDPFITTLQQYPDVVLAGVYSHFANIEDTDDISHAKKQISGLQEAADRFRSYGYTSVQTHISSTSGLLVHDQHSTENFLVRIGLGLYGLYPSEALSLRYGDKLTLKPVLRWVSHLAQTKWLPEGYTVGYGLTYTTQEPTNLAIVPQGYSDGLDRGLSNNGTVLVHGKHCPILGRVAMNMVAISVSHIPNPKAGDEVVLLGMQADHHLTAEEIAERLDTINYEVVTRISPLLPRLIVDK